MPTLTVTSVAGAWTGRPARGNATDDQLVES